MASKTTFINEAPGGGQFAPEKGGQFAPDLDGQVRPERGGQFVRIFHLNSLSTNLKIVILQFQKYKDNMSGKSLKF